MDSGKQREGFASRLGFILVSAGCAVGIGNVWRFPTVTGQNGGGVFVLFYLLFLVLMGVPVLTMELAVGRAGHNSAVKAYKALEPKGTKWHLHGWVCMIGCALLMMYYTTVAGWMLDYFFKFLTGRFTGLTPDASAQVFSDALANPGEQVLWMVVITVLGFLVCQKGLQGGLERIGKWMMGALLVLILVYCIGSDIAIYRFGLTVPGTPSAQSDMTNDSSDHGTNADASVPSGSGTGSEVVIQQQEKPEASVQAEDGSQKAADGTYTVEGVAAAVRPSIVEIYTYGDANQKQLSGTGSGIILSEDGYIITNAHVLTDGKSFTVTLSDETEYTATVVGSDSKTDLAVIHVDAKDLPAATMGDSDEVVLGEAVVAIGNPAGLTGSVTNGIVSGLNRQIQSDSTGYAMNCIQTNAAISPGNSGGALVNMYGQVIGITSSKYVSSSYEGLGFAITINDVLPIIQDLVQYGHVKDRVRIGITFISLEAEEIQIQFADALQMDSAPAGLQGIWVTEIDDSCDVGNTSLQVNDVIVKVDEIGRAHV